MTTRIAYGPSKDAWQGFGKLLTDLIAEYHIKRICDIGGGANPLISDEYIEDKCLDYSLLDISAYELSKAPSAYNKIVADIASPNFSIDYKFDLVFTKMVAEHISDAEQFHRNVLSCLADNGLAVHFFPTLYTLPFFSNYIFPQRFADVLLNVFAPRDRHQHEKFPAYYRWCHGPTRRQLQRFISLGYDIVEYKGFFGHNGYYKKIKLLEKIHISKTNYLLRHPNPLFTSYAYVVLKKKA
jgi:2-polyprenyl-3-methyl-5-hydroxy-6-metoxy-1,4-benzoquinol methylase